MIRDLRTGILGVLACVSSTVVSADDGSRPDLLALANGAVPVAITSAPNDLKVGMDQAIGLIDGSPSKQSVLRKPATAGDVIEFTFSLPAPTRFDGFSVPNVLETPSPSQTFVGRVEVMGATQAVDGPYVLLASQDLVLHPEPGQSTDLALTNDQPDVSFVKVRLSGGTDLQVEKSFLEFSEIVGTGVQQEPPLAETFQGVFGGRGVKMELEQNGAVVSGCYDGTSELTGTVQGNILRALGQNPAGIPSQFILVSAGDGAFVGLRSSNGAPFKPYNGVVSTKGATCLSPEPPKLGCGSIIHGIGFDYDSDVIRPSSQSVIEDLFDGLKAAAPAHIDIVGHSSSEGAEDYNQDLSRRRAASVVGALVDLGLGQDTLLAVGRGEVDPIASNDTEAGRSLNRRVEVLCRQ